MIPKRIKLKNFMSYGEDGAELSFESLHLACLSGDNGNGKSALLDALTWSLWGKTRSSATQSVSEDDLIRIGANEMEVVFEFELNEQRYRVIRKRKRGRGSDWNLSLQDQTGEYRAVGGSSQRETKDQLSNLLSMKYDTFINSAYLAQGRADEFTRQKPTERKRILGEILGLERFEILEQQSREKSRQCRESLVDLNGRQGVLESSIAELPAHQLNLNQISEKLKELEAQLAIHQGEAEKQLQEKNRLDRLAVGVRAQTEALTRMVGERDQRRKELQECKLRLQGYQRVLEQRDSILKDFNDLQRHRRETEQLRAEVENFTKKQAEIRELETEIEREKLRLENELQLRNRDVSVAEKAYQQKTQLEKELAILKQELLHMPEVSRKVDQLTKEKAELTDKFAEMSAAVKTLKQEITEQEEVVLTLQRPLAVCPVCDRDLGEPLRQRVLERQQNKLAEAQQELNRFKREGRDIKTRLDEITPLLEESSRDQQNLVLKRDRLESRVRTLEELQPVLANLDSLRKESAELQKRLSDQDFCVPKRLHLTLLRKSSENLKQSKEAYDRGIQRIKQLEGAEKRHQELMDAETGRKREEEQRGNLENDLAVREADCRSEQARLAEARKPLELYDQIKRAAEAAAEKQRQLQYNVDSARQSRAVAASKIESCKADQKELHRLDTEIRKVKSQESVYNDLTTAFSKNGIQSLIIDRTLPELEEEANSLLGRMTDNSMRVTFKTERAAKSSKTPINTLDIEITDNAGPRPYELFSGGEGFRINFAIRIALSRLLARRSGAKLQTLVLDEGFGSQDGKGREKLLEAIDSIQDDFKMILVITHFEELKDQFPQRIEIQKGPYGSEIHMV